MENPWNLLDKPQKQVLVIASAVTVLVCAFIFFLVVLISLVAEDKSPREKAFDDCMYQVSYDRATVTECATHFGGGKR